MDSDRVLAWYIGGINSDVLGRLYVKVSGRLKELIRAELSARAQARMEY